MTTFANKTSRANVPEKSLITKLNMGTGLIVGIIFAEGMYWLSKSWFDINEAREINKILTLSMIAWCIGFLIGIGAFIGPFRWLIGKDLTDEEQLYMAGSGQGISRYFKYCTDHKVVGIQ
ncbi:MAG: hypothetical protein JHC72_08700, partial [Candidatus Nanopelagicus sp.]|nr:hypothetical protein [Candidatus Nanopelagicus sp.]